MELFLVRHGETDWNRQGRIQGWIDVGLNETGRRQARATVDELPSVESFDLVASPLRRARTTAEILIDRLSVGDVWFRDEFRELNQGHWNGLRGEWLLEQKDPRFLGWINDPLNGKPPGGESLKTVRDRVRAGLDFLGQHADSPVLLVAHKVVNSLVASLLGSVQFEDVMESLPENAAVFEIQAERETLIRSR